MNYMLLKIVHLSGLGLTFMGLADVLAVQMNGGESFKKRWIFHAAHGVGLLLLILTGIAMAAQLQHFADSHEPPGWVKAKLGIWHLAGGSMVLATV
jgi:uncharacterized membrane protein SirB2